MPSHKKLLKQEERQESSFMFEIGTYLSFVASCREDNTPTEYTSFETKRDRKGNKVEDIPVMCRAQDIVNSETRRKYHVSQGQTKLIRLSQAETERDNYVPWLREFSERYANLDMGGQEWLRKVALKAMKVDIAENKWLGWWQLEDKDDPDEDYWADPLLRNFYGFCYLARTGISPLFAKLLTKFCENIIKEPKNQELRKVLTKELIQEFAEGITDMLLLSPVRDVVHDTEEEWQHEERKDATRKKQSSAIGQIQEHSSIDEAAV